MLWPYQDELNRFGRDSSLLELSGAQILFNVTRHIKFEKFPILSPFGPLYRIKYILSALDVMAAC